MKVNIHIVCIRFILMNFCFPFQYFSFLYQMNNKKTSLFHACSLQTKFDSFFLVLLLYYRLVLIERKSPCTLKISGDQPPMIGVSLIPMGCIGLKLYLFEIPQRLLTHLHLLRLYQSMSLFEALNRLLIY